MGTDFLSGLTFLIHEAWLGQGDLAPFRYSWPASEIPSKRLPSVHSHPGGFGQDFPVKPCFNLSLGCAGSEA